MSIEEKLKIGLGSGIGAGGHLFLSYAAYLDLGGEPIEGGAPYGVCIHKGVVTKMAPPDQGDDGQ